MSQQPAAARPKRPPKSRTGRLAAPDLDALLAYRQKRDFERTPEPRAGRPGPAGVPAEAGDLTFVVQQHRATRMHWDFRLEVDGVLASWAVPKGPSLDPKEKRMAAQVEDHPFDYGGFEGVIPRGNYGAGEVIVWDNGTYTPDEGGVYSWGDRDEGSRRMREGIAAGKLSFTLRGKKLRGSWTLVRMGGTRNADGRAWLLIKHRDAYASTRDVLEDDRSVVSGLSVRDLREGRMPRAGAAAKPHRGAVEAPFPDAKTLRPMLPTLVAGPFSRAGWIFEPKLDGVRALAFVRDGNIELRSRRGNAITVQYPEAVDALGGLRARAAVLDGEICALDERGAPDFQALQGRINLLRPADVARAAAETPVIYYVFDLLHLDGYDLARLPCVDRKAVLHQRLGGGARLRYVEHVEDDGERMYASAVGLGFEGVVAKRAASVYEPGVRSRSWLKAKAAHEQEFVVGGYTEGEGARTRTFGGILVGTYDGGALRFAASVGSGFTDHMLDHVAKRLRALRSDSAPFADPPAEIGGRWAGGRAARCFWVKPELVARVRFSAWTRDGNLRAPVFQGLRDDIDPRTVVRETAVRRAVDVIAGDPAPTAGDGSLASAIASVLGQLEGNRKDAFTLDVGGAKIRLTNLDKVFWPATKEHAARTKRELVRYYARVAPYILPHLRDRPLTLNRYPNGIEGKNFYQKHWPQAFPKDVGVERVMLYSAHNDADGEYVLVNNLATLLWLAQLADIEMHPWMARTDPEPDAHGLPTTFAGSEEVIDRSVLNYPDFMVFDLDPYIYAGDEKKGEEPALNRRAFEKTREVAFALRDVLQQLRLSSFVKTTGKTGLHVFVPVLRQHTYDEIRAATETLGRFLAQQRPDDVTMEWQVPKRTGKVFFDHNQNARGKTLASQYSLRPTPHAAASAPVTWDELARVYPTDFDIDTLPARLETRGDIWKDILDAKQDLRALLDATA